MRVTRGYLDNVSVNKVSAYETEMLGELRSAGASILASIKDKKALNDDIEAKLNAFLDGFSKGYVATRSCLIREEGDYAKFKGLQNAYCLR